MTTTDTTQAPAPEQQRRVDGQASPRNPLDWGDDGTPLAPSSALRQYRPRDDAFRLWSDIQTEELLACVQAEPARFELRTVFTMPVDELVRAPSVVVLTALAVFDQARRDREAAALKLRAALAALEEMP